jgi:predicted RNA-binding Zn-ribbon protein involved in translation (DUF1610 family)
MIQQFIKWVKTKFLHQTTNLVKTLCPKCGTVCLNEIRKGESASMIFVRNDSGDLIGVCIKYKCPHCNSVYAIPLENVNKPEAWIEITNEL